MLLVTSLIAGVLSVTQAAQTERLGTINFPTSCSSEVQPTIERGVALLHSFQYDEAKQAFEDASRRDASCAMCHWGKAMTLYRPLFGEWPTPQMLEEGHELIRRAEQLGGMTARERGYLTAAAAFFNAPTTTNRVERIRAYSQQFGILHRRFPEDGEATAFYALSMLALAGEDVHRLSNHRQAIAILKPLVRQQPNHPGAAHYLIHATDRPEFASLGLEAARKYASIAPDSSHALHMPSHIFLRLGLWEEAIALNVRAAASGAHAAMEHRGDSTMGHTMGREKFILQHVVDAQQAQTATRDNTIGIVFSLVGLYLHVEKGFTGAAVQKAHQKLGRQKRQWPTVLLPKSRGSITAIDVMAAPAGPERDAAIDRWCETVWKAFSDNRDVIVRLVAEAGIA